jgi:hypothetical protein
MSGGEEEKNKQQRNSAINYFVNYSIAFCLIPHLKNFSVSCSMRSRDGFGWTSLDSFKHQPTLNLATAFGKRHSVHFFGHP